MNDMETAVEMLERQLDDTWGIVGKTEGANLCHMFLAMMTMVALISIWIFGPNVWIGGATIFIWATTVVFQPLVESHFSKKYMRLANGE